jgi:hypothetical protein
VFRLSARSATAASLRLACTRATFSMAVPCGNQSLRALDLQLLSALS